MGSSTIPVVQEFPSQVTAGVKAIVAMGPEFDAAIVPSLDKVEAWLGEQGIQEYGPTYIRYDVIDMPGRLEVEIGWFLAQEVAPEVAARSGDIAIGKSPAGRYATTRYTGHYEGLYNATAQLIGWAEQEGVEWDAWDTPEGHAFAGRYEIYHTDPGAEPDPEKWLTEIAIKVKE